MSIRVLAISAMLALTALVTPAAADPNQWAIMGQVANTPLGLPVIHGSPWGTWEFRGAVSGPNPFTLSLSGQLDPGSSGTSSCNNYRVTLGNGSGGGHDFLNLSGEYVNGTLTLSGTSAGHAVTTIVLHYTYPAAHCASGTATYANAAGVVTVT